MVDQPPVSAASHSSTGVTAPEPITASAAGRSYAHVDLAVGSPNAALARRHALEAALADVEAAVISRDNYNAQNATKRALEAIHELDDCLRRNEWSQSGWTADEIGIWKGHVGARNVAHHQSAGIVLLHGEGPADEHLKWGIAPQAVAALPSKPQAVEYRARLDGRPVLPPLRALLARVQANVT